MEQMELKKKIEEIVLQSIEMDINDNRSISYDADLREFGMDSVNCISIIVDVEDFFGFEFFDEDLVLDNFMTISCLADYVSRRIDSLNKEE